MKPNLIWPKLTLIKIKLFAPNFNAIFESPHKTPLLVSKHGMNQTEAEYSGHGKRSQRARLSQIGPVVLEV